MIDGMITRIAEELGEPEEALTVIATGGALEKTITACCEHPIIFDDQLVLHGLWLIWLKNQGSHSSGRQSGKTRQYTKDNR